ncbi:MAG: HPr family phosphocarrier protein [Candidatus Kapabacteria bacterium]|nr:HPr family phosphocarrier protein [Candidatus Kapabacteria bacterium]
MEVPVTVRNRAGIHTRPAATIVKLASKFQSEVFLCNDGFEVNAKSIIGVMTLTAEQGAILTLKVEGPDEEIAAKEIGELFENSFNE